MAEPMVVNGHRLPSLLLQLIRQDRWKHPGDEVVRGVMPFLVGPIDFLTTVEQIERSSPRVPPSDADVDKDLRELDRILEAELEQAFRMVRGSRAGRPVDLPELDCDQAVVIGVNREYGDDLWVALDYRSGNADPRVVATDWNLATGASGCGWREVTPTFALFVAALGLEGPGAEPGAAPDGPSKPGPPVSL